MAQQVDVNKVKKGDYVIIDDEPCIVKSVNKGMAGKHGHVKVNIQAEGLFDESAHRTRQSAGHPIMKPTIEKKTGQVVSKDGQMAQVMDMDTYQTEDMQLPDDLDVGEGEEISYWLINDRKLVKGKA